MCTHIPRVCAIKFQISNWMRRDLGGKINFPELILSEPSTSSHVLRARSQKGFDKLDSKLSLPPSSHLAIVFAITIKRIFSYPGIYIDIERQFASQLRKGLTFRRLKLLADSELRRSTAFFLHGCYMWLINVNIYLFLWW